MQETKTAAQICTAAADHIETHGLLFDGWDSEDGTKDLAPCCCLIGTMRYVTGETPRPTRKGVAAIEGTPLFEALEAVKAQTMGERHALTDHFRGPDSIDMMRLTEWSDHYSDVEGVCRKRRNGLPEYRRLDHDDGDRRHVVAMLRAAAHRCETTERAGRKRNTNCLEGLRCPGCGSLGPFAIGTHSTAIVHDDGIESTADHDWDKNSPIVCQQCDESDSVADFMID